MFFSIKVKKLKSFQLFCTWKLMDYLPKNLPTSTQVFHSNRINLSPFTKDFRVWGTPIETIIIS